MAVQPLRAVQRQPQQRGSHPLRDCEVAATEIRGAHGGLHNPQIVGPDPLQQHGPVGMEHRPDELGHDGQRLVGPGGHGFDEVQVMLNAGTAGQVRAQGFHAHPGHGLHGGQDGVDEPVRRERDDEVVHGAVRAAFDDVQADDVDGSLAQRGRDRAQGAGAVRQDEAKQIRHVAKNAVWRCRCCSAKITGRYRCWSPSWRRSLL